MKNLLNKERRASYFFLAKWICLAVLAGILGSFSVYSFQFLFITISSFLTSFKIPLPVWSLAGAAVAGGVFYRLQPDAAGEGVPSYLQGMNIHKGYLPLPVTIFKYFSALATLSTFGNGGVVGPLGRFSAGIMSTLGALLQKVGFAGEDRRTAAVCGMAAVVGTVFHSPLGGGIFAVEILQRAKMGYKDLFPAILSSIVAVSICRFLDLEPFYRISATDKFMNLSRIGWLLILSALLGYLGGLYTRLYSLIVRLFKRDRGNVLLKVAGGTLLASVPAWLINPGLLGTSSEMFGALFAGDLSILTGIFHSRLPVALALIVMLVLKALFNCLTVGSGMSAGFTGPSVLIGMLLGSSLANFLRIPAFSPDYYAFLAAGFSGMLASSMNVPLAAAVITTEIFGLNYSLPAGLAAIIGFQINRHQTIYDYALAGASEKVARK